MQVIKYDQVQEKIINIRNQQVIIDLMWLSYMV